MRLITIVEAKEKETRLGGSLSTRSPWYWGAGCIYLLFHLLSLLSDLSKVHKFLKRVEKLLPLEVLV